MFDILPEFKKQLEELIVVDMPNSEEDYEAEFKSLKGIYGKELILEDIRKERLDLKGND